MEYLFTERAHLMCPHMQFGIACLLPCECDPRTLAQTARTLAECHPFLRSLLYYDAEKHAYAYRVTEQPQTEILCREAEVTGIADPEITVEMNCLTAREWDLTREGMLKIAAWKAGGKTCLLFVFHHLLADGRGAFGLVREFVDCAVRGILPARVPETLIAKADLPRGSELPAVSRLLVHRANRQWAKENHVLTYEKYLDFADRWLSADTVNRSVREIGERELAETVAECRANGVSVNDWLMAQMFLTEGADKIVMAADLREKLPNYRAGALGNYATAFSVEYKKKAADVFAAAKDVHRLTRKITETPKSLWLVLQCYAELNGDLLDAAFAAAQGGFASRAASFIGTVFFGFGCAGGYSVTNLGKFECETIEAACFLPPASPAMKKTQGVLTLNGKAVICTAARP